MSNDAISRSAVLETLCNGCDSRNNTPVPRCGDMCADFKEVLKLPALDVAPVVHARWIRDDLGNTRCSNCHTWLPFRHCYDDEDGYEWDYEIDETPWCMHCGARMDGGDAE